VSRGRGREGVMWLREQGRKDARGWIRE